MSGTGEASDVVVVGGGLIGCSLALELARRGSDVCVVERASPAGEATWAAGGMLSPFTEAAGSSDFLELGLDALARYREWAADLAAASGIAVEYADPGQLEVALDGAERERLRRAFEWQHRVDSAIRWLEPEEACQREPELTREVTGAVLIEREHLVDNRALGRAAWRAAEREGVRFRLGEEARGVERGKGRVSGVRLASGERVEGGAVVVAAGCWSGRLEGLPRPLPVEPVRGQMAAARARPDLLRHVVFSTGCYLIPRQGGRVVIGSTMERAGYLKETTVAGLGGLLAAAVLAVPGVAGAALEESWSGLRPGTPDGMPILGADPEVEGLWYATGHFRNGILLAPVTASLLADLMTGREPAHDPSPYRADRF